MKINYSEVLPSAGLSDWVKNFWLFEIPETYNNGQPFEYELIPENNLSLVFVKLGNTRVATFSGIRTLRMEKTIYPGTLLTGIRFNPWVNIPSLFGDKQNTLNQVVECPQFVQELFKNTMSNLDSNFEKNLKQIENELIKLNTQHTILFDDLSKYICLNLDQNEKKIKDIVKDIPMAIRPLQKRFKKIVGISMIEYRNIGRFRESTKSIFFDKNTISYSAMLGGYTDHAHFIHSFQKYMAGKNFRSFFQQNKDVNLKK